MSAAQGLRPHLMQQQQSQQKSMFSNLFSQQNIDMLKQHPQTARLFADGEMEKKMAMVRCCSVLVDGCILGSCKNTTR